MSSSSTRLPCSWVSPLSAHLCKSSGLVLFEKGCRKSAVAQSIALAVIGARVQPNFATYTSSDLAAALVEPRLRGISH